MSKPEQQPSLGRFVHVHLPKVHSGSEHPETFPGVILKVHNATSLDLFVMTHQGGKNLKSVAKGAAKESEPTWIWPPYVPPQAATPAKDDEPTLDPRTPEE